MAREKKEDTVKETKTVKPKKKVTKTVKKEKELKELKEEVTIVKENKKTTSTKTGKYSARDILIILVLALVFGLLLGSFLTKKCKKSIKEIEEVDEVYNDIIENHYGLFDDKSINDSIIFGLLTGLDDKYAFYVNSKKALLDYYESINGQFIGIGVQIIGDEDGNIKVVAVNKNSPAEKAGILVDDIIVKMDEKKYNSVTLNDLTYEIKTSKVGTEKEFELTRGEEEVKVKIKLEKVDVESVTYSTQEKNGILVGIIKIDNYANNTFDQFIDAYNKLKEKRVSALVLDLRDNSEGLIENASKIASLFLAKNSVIYQINEGSGFKDVKSEDDRLINLPTAVVIDDSTVSTSEIIASALNENLNVQLVGTRTYGKGYMQDIIKLANGRYAQHTTKEWKTSKGLFVEDNGIKPTQEVNCEEETCEIDVQLEKAIEVVSSKMGQV